MKKNWCYDYPRPAYTADCIVFTAENLPSEIVLIKRKHEPFKDMWALPGGFVEIDEKGLDAGKRELYEETGIKADELFELGVYDTPGRDPRGRTVTVVFYTIFRNAAEQMTANDDAAEVKLFPTDNLPDLAFDHEKIISDAIKTVLLKDEK